MNPVAMTAMISGSLFPVLGLSLYDWDIVEVIGFYWYESFVIVLFSSLKIPFVQLERDRRQLPIFVKGYGLRWARVGRRVTKTFSFLFFYLGFCFFLWIGLSFLLQSPLQAQPQNIVNSYNVLLLTYGISYVLDFWREREYKTLTIDDVFWQPYPRIIGLWLFMFFLAYIHSKGLDTTITWISIGFILMKSLVDAFLYYQEHNFKETAKP